MWWADDITYPPPRLPLIQLSLFSAALSASSIKPLNLLHYSCINNFSILKSPVLFCSFPVYPFLWSLQLQALWMLLISRRLGSTSHAIMIHFIFLVRFQLPVYRIEDIPPSPGFTPWLSRLPSQRYFMLHLFNDSQTVLNLRNKTFPLPMNKCMPA